MGSAKSCTVYAQVSRMNVSILQKLSHIYFFAQVLDKLKEKWVRLMSVKNRNESYHRKFMAVNKH